MAGFSLVAADNPSMGPSLRAAARRAADEFVASVEAAPERSRERQYLNELLMAAVSFAAGLSRRQQERTQRVIAAEEERKLNFRRIVQSQRLGGILRGGIQLLVLGGFTYFFIRGLFPSRWLSAESTASHRDYPALAAAFASSLIGSFFKAFYTGWRINQVDQRYKQALREAKEIYHAEAVQEYEFAAQEANLAWQKYTGKPPAITEAFRVLIVGLLAGDKERAEAKVSAKRKRAKENEIPSEVDEDDDGPLDGALPHDISKVMTVPPEAPPSRTPGGV